MGKGCVMSQAKMEDIISLCKRRGFIYQGSDVYGGLSGTWDYGPLGVQLKRNIMNLWWRRFVDERDDMYGVDAAILMNQKVWQASGHVDTFSDPLVECNHCKARFREDHLLKDQKEKLDEYEALTDKIQWYREHATAPNFYDEIKEKEPDLFKKILDMELGPSEIDLEEASDFGLKEWSHVLRVIKCPNCGTRGNFSEPRQFNMMFKTFVGASGQNELAIDELTGGVDGKRSPNGMKAITYDPQSISYLRPETAQGIFTNFKNVVDSFYPNLPFGIAQQGKAFRNEIAPRDFVFRSREFEQMEIEYFVDPEHWQEAFDELLAATHAFLAELGLKPEHIHELDVPAEDRAHYSKKTIDIEYDYPIGREELMGIAYRTDFDLMNIQRASGKSMEYTVKGTNTKFVPHVIEPSFGVERALMAVLSGAYREDEQNGEKRVYLALPEHLAPVKFAVSPLLKNKPELVEKAREVYAQLAKANPGRVMWDDNGNIGKRYRRQDEIGTPHCVVIDFQTLEDGTVTVRERDTTEQRRVKVEEL
ncbi:glycine--tRNA ligase [Candidatus Saccharibacteria bacterium oral taxon 488]|nr:glycine--tRNA ligase [Candidatus Saccharibacteria bacterium oral taxon 488]